MTSPAEVVAQVALAGAEFVVVYPFVREPVEIPCGDESGFGYVTVESWKPGTREVENQHGEWREADGEGRMVLTVVSAHKPGKYPTRVFYTRRWVDPDGKEFGKGGCKIATLGVFRRLCAGYRVGLTGYGEKPYVLAAKAREALTGEGNG